ncbi:FprA family A-type flavoprotein [bacterium]|nr:FprA family A-type flavoprotein [bacterium]
MIIKEIKKDMYGFVLHDWSRKLFDELIPLPDGTTYNSYFIKDNKSVLIDTADPTKTEELFAILKEIDVANIDYIVSNHSEQDHSGSIPALLSAFPNAKVVTSEKGAGFLKSMLLVPQEKIMTVADGEELSLGARTLKFLHTPWVHWPETIVTFCPEEKTLFPCDFFGSHLASSDFYARCDEKQYISSKRYYAEIMMPFRNNISRHLGLIEDLSIDIIAPSHGPVYNNPSFIIDAYKDWVSDKVKNQVVLPYVSMHGSVAKMTEFFVDELIKRGVEVKPFNLTSVDIGELAMSLVDAATLVLGSPMVLAGPHPVALYAAYLFKILRPKTRFASVIGSFGWGGNMLKVITDMLPTQGLEVIEPVMAKGYPKEEDFVKLQNLAEEIQKRHKELI